MEEYECSEEYECNYELYDDYINLFYCENIEKETELQSMGIYCSEDFLFYLKENVKILDLYCALVVDKHDYLRQDVPIGMNLHKHRFKTNFCEDFINDFYMYEERVDFPKVEMFRGNVYHFSACPFHQVGNDIPFSIDDEKNLFYCFGCGYSGNVFHFMQENFDMDILEIIKTLALIAKLTIPEENKPQDFYINFYRLFDNLTFKEISKLSNNQFIRFLGKGFAEAYLLRLKAREKQEKILTRVDQYIAYQYKIGVINEYTINDAYLIRKICNRLCINECLLKKRLRYFFENSKGEEITKSIIRYIKQLDKNNIINDSVIYDDDQMASIAEKLGIGKNLVEKVLVEFYKEDYEKFIDTKIEKLIANKIINISRLGYNKREMSKCASSIGVDILTLDRKIKYKSLYGSLK